MKLDWKGRDSGCSEARCNAPDGRSLDLAVTELGYPHVGCCEILINVYKDGAWSKQIACFRVRMTIGRAQQRAAKLAELLAPVID